MDALAARSAHIFSRSEFSGVVFKNLQIKEERTETQGNVRLNYMLCTHTHTHLCFLCTVVLGLADI